MYCSRKGPRNKRLLKSDVLKELRTLEEMANKPLEKTGFIRWLFIRKKPWYKRSLEKGQELIREQQQLLGMISDAISYHPDNTRMRGYLKYIRIERIRRAQAEMWLLHSYRYHGIGKGNKALDKTIVRVNHIYEMVSDLSIRIERGGIRS